MKDMTRFPNVGGKLIATAFVLSAFSIGFYSAPTVVVRVLADIPATYGFSTSLPALCWVANEKARQYGDPPLAARMHEESSGSPVPLAEKGVTVSLDGASVVVHEGVSQPNAVHVLTIEDRPSDVPRDKMARGELILKMKATHALQSDVVMLLVIAAIFLAGCGIKFLQRWNRTRNTEFRPAAGAAGRPSAQP